jgi:23S rRNA (cytidine2498-2'-O)-methyltransferase
MSASGRSVLAYCRPGFESECAQELAARDAALASGGFARSTRDSGFVEFVFLPILPRASASLRP